MPTLELKPASSFTKGHDSTWGQFRKYGLPSEEIVKAYVDGSAPQSGAFKVKEEELIQRIVDGRESERREEIVQRVKEVVERYCETDAEGYLGWK